MTALYIILGIILFFVILFSVRLSVILSYGEKNTLSIKWLFINIPIYDSEKPKKKKPKKEKKKKDTKEESKDDTKEEKKEDKPKKGGNSLVKQLYLDRGIDGIEKMLYSTGKALGGFFGKLFKTVTVDEFYLQMKIVGSDAADTAISYGKLSAWLFPTLGKMVSTCKVKKYDVNVSPDFLGNEKEASLYTRISVTPLRITNAAVVLVFELLFKVLLKVLSSSSKSKKSATVNKGEIKKSGEASETKEASEIKEEASENKSLS